ncbi:hypothetical protein [Streptacidiphilus sp. PAMC 29251]
MTEYPNHVAIAQKLLEQQGEIADFKARTERAEATISRVRAECDRIEAAVRDNPQDHAFDAGYLASLKWIRHALDGTEDGDGEAVADIPLTSRNVTDIEGGRQ